MNFFTKTEMVYEEQTGKLCWQQAKTALKAAGIEFSSGSGEKEPPVGGCVAKLDIRDFGPRGKIDRHIYYIETRISDAPRARKILAEIKADHQI